MLSLFWWKRCETPKSWFQPVNRVWSTRLLIEIHNTHQVLCVRKDQKIEYIDRHIGQAINTKNLSFRRRRTLRTCWCLDLKFRENNMIIPTRKSKFFILVAFIFISTLMNKNFFLRQHQIETCLKYALKQIKSNPILIFISVYLECSFTFIACT